MSQNGASPCIADNGPTDKWAGTMRTAGPGGFARATFSTLNRRYFADLYMDTSLARVMLVQGSVSEIQIPTSWSDTSITFTVNLGAAVPGAASLVVFNSGGTQVGSFAVTI